ncbi:MAG: zinc ABC transporter substrate-binding protein [Beijerinckiaceae bacterium]
MIASRAFPFRAALAACCLMTATVASHAQVKVVASIKPVHSLVSSVMQGAGKPDLIVQGGGSPHTYTMRPSDAKALQNAQVVVWIGERLERFLEGPVKSLAGKARVLELADVKGLTAYPFRSGGAWEKHSHGKKKASHKHSQNHGHDHGRDHSHGHDHAGTDSHIWMDPANAKLFVTAIVGALSEADPANAALYRKNGEAEKERLDTLIADINSKLEPVRGKGFVVFHDAFQYFEKRFGLTGAGSISLGDGRAPGAKRLREIRAKLASADVACVFSEPQFEPRLVRTVIEGSAVRTGVLDPLGAKIQDGPGLYEKMMRNNADSLYGCLAGKR